MTSIKKIVAAASPDAYKRPGAIVLPANKRRAATPRPIPILTYHQFVASSAPRPRSDLLCLTQAQFARQMGLIHAMGYRGLSMGELKPYLSGEKSGRVVGITMDDGYQSNLELALPVLQRWGFTATCFVVSGYLGRSNLWEEAADGSMAPLMDVAQLQAWIAGGQEVGSHTQTHCDLTRCSPEQAWREIHGSRDALARALNAPVQHFSYPYGFFNAEHVAMVQQAGYDMALSTRGGRARCGENLYALPRLEFVHLLQLAYCLSKPPLRAFWRARSRVA